MSDSRFDELFIQVAGQAGGIVPLLDSFFGFLQRKTDFYVEFEDNTVAHKMGFPKGEAERMLLKAFRKYEFRVLEEPAVSIEPESKKPNITSKTDDITNYKITKTNESPSLPQPQYTEDDVQIPIGNGGVGPNYYWTQTLNEVNIYIDLPATDVKSKNVSCNITPKSIQLEVFNSPLLSGSFEGTVKASECMWTLSKTTENEVGQIIVTLDKVVKTWWKSVVIGHPAIDTKKVDSSQNISEYDADTQASIRRIMYDQKQKMLGLPLSENSPLKDSSDNAEMLMKMTESLDKQGI